MLLRQVVAWALAFALANAGNSIAAKMAMMAMTTSSSIKVKACPLGFRRTLADESPVEDLARNKQDPCGNARTPATL